MSPVVETDASKELLKPLVWAKAVPCGIHLKRRIRTQRVRVFQLASDPQVRRQWGYVRCSVCGTPRSRSNWPSGSALGKRTRTTTSTQAYFVRPAAQLRITLMEEPDARVATGLITMNRPSGATS